MLRRDELMSEKEFVQSAIELEALRGRALASETGYEGQGKSSLYYQRLSVNRMLRLKARDRSITAELLEGWFSD